MRLIYCAFALSIALLAGVDLSAHSTGPRPRHTGGFSEDSCNKCHTSHPLNAGRILGGVFYLEGVPKNFEAGKGYRLKIKIGHPDQSRWGFQLSSRFAGTGSQAGRLVSSDEFTQIKESNGVQYIEHTEVGTREMNPDGPVEFGFTWIAPAAAHEPVIFNAAGNAADDSGDPEGDYIYTASGFSRPTPGWQGAVPQLPQQKERQQRRIATASVFYHVPAPVDLLQGQMEFQIQHRFLGPLTDDSLGDLLGIDRGANINLGFSYALTDDLAVGVGRARFNKIVNFNSTWEIKTDQESFWSMSLFGGVEGQNNFHEHYSPFLQLATTFDHSRFRFILDPTLILNSRNDRELEFKSKPINPNSNHTFSLGLGVDAMLTRNISLIWEFVPRIAGFGGFGSEKPALTGGIKIRTWGHVFSVGVSNSHTFTPARYALNTEGEFSLGFNIYRRIR